MHCALLLTRLVVKLWGYQVEFEVLKPGIFKVLIISIWKNSLSNAGGLLKNVPCSYK